MSLVPHTGSTAKRARTDGDTRDDEGTDVIPSHQIKLGGRANFGPPDKMRVTLRYVENSFTITSVSGVNGNYYFSCNSLFDPNRTGGGHQPLYFDQLTGLYNHYTVNASEIKATFVNVSTTVQGRVALGISDDTSGASLEAAFEQRHAVAANITPLSGSRSLVVMKNRWNSDMMLGIDAANDGSNKTGVASNPTEESFFQLVFFSLTGGSTDAVSVSVEIHYDCIFSELTTPANS